MPTMEGRRSAKPNVTWSSREHVLRSRPTELDSNARCSSLTEVSCRPKPSETLLRYYSGEVTEEQYLEERINCATLHLRGKLSVRKFERIRRAVKRICATDPLFLAIKTRVLRQQSKRRRS